MKTHINNPAFREVGHERGRVIYELVEPLVLEAMIGTGRLRIVVPAGFRTDFASVPRWLWWLMPPMGKHNKAAVIHDWLYRERHGLSRFLSDALFREVMWVDTVRRWRRIVAYYGVRICGWMYWQEEPPR